MKCPTCFKKLDANTGVDHESQPKPGDFSICAYCGEFFEFNDQLQLVQIPIEKEKIYIKKFPSEMITLQKVRSIIKEKIQQQ